MSSWKRQILRQGSPSQVHQSSGAAVKPSPQSRSRSHISACSPRQIPSVDVTTHSPMLLCTVRHAAWILTRHKVRRDTSDAVREDSWTENRQEILQLGVQVLARRPGGNVNQLLPPWSLKLGRDTLSGEHLVGTPAGVVTRWVVRRLQEAARWVPGALKAMLFM